MPATRRLATRALGIALSLAAVSITTPVHGDPRDEVDQSLLVPTTLDSSFAPFTCTPKRTGPVCTGERRIDTGWAPSDLPCHVPLHGRYVSYRHSTRYYDTDYLNYARRFRINDVDYLGTSPGGPATATISVHGRFFEPFAVPGDASTFTVITSGTIFDVRPVGGPPIFRVVGTLVEPPEGAVTFTGQVRIDDTVTSYDGELLDIAVIEEQLFEAACRAATEG